MAWRVSVRGHIRFIDSCTIVASWSPPPCRFVLSGNQNHLDRIATAVPQPAESIRDVFQRHAVRDQLLASEPASQRHSALHIVTPSPRGLGSNNANRRTGYSRRSPLCRNSSSNVCSRFFACCPCPLDAEQHRDAARRCPKRRYNTS